MNDITVNISKAKTNFSKYAKLVKKGNRIILADRNIPFAQIIPLSSASEDIAAKRKKMIGSLKGKVSLIGDINQPLTEEELNNWYNGILRS